MITIRVCPANKAHFIRLKAFGNEMLAICDGLGITPVAWGGLVFFGYTKDRNAIIHDVDLLVPNKSIKKVMAVLRKRKIRYHYYHCTHHNKRWHALVVSKGDAQVDLDPIEDYYKGPRSFRKFKTFDFGGFRVKVVGKGSLIKAYRRASEVSKDKPGQHLKRLEALKRTR